MIVDGPDRYKLASANANCPLAGRSCSCQVKFIEINITLLVGQAFSVCEADSSLVFGFFVVVVVWRTFWTPESGAGKEAAPVPPRSAVHVNTNS